MVSKIPSPAKERGRHFKLKLSTFKGFHFLTTIPARLEILFQMLAEDQL
jgi:hypothetical protein